MVPPALKTVMSALAMLSTFAGSNARNTGLKPPINASRSKAGDAGQWDESTMAQIVGPYHPV